VVVCAEVKKLVAPTAGVDLTVECAVTEDGPWLARRATAPLPLGDTTFYLGRDPGFAVEDRLAGFLRWKISGSPQSVWVVCFRISVLLEPAGGYPRRK
jgi:hypothetical protein